MKNLRKLEIADYREFVAVLQLSPRAVAAFIQAHECEVAFSHIVEHHANEGTFAADVFAILCGEA